MTNALVPAAPSDPWSILYDEAGLSQLVRLANTISTAGLVPAHLRGQIPDIVLALGIARAMNENPILVLQSIYVINGRACWSAQYLIARANRSGRFRGPINWREEGEGDSLVVTAFAIVAETGERVESTVSMAMARADGWAGKNKKYQTIPVVMLRYRSATLLVRQFCPDVLMGLHERNELIDVHGEYTDPEPASSPPRVSRAPQPADGGRGPVTEAGSSLSPGVECHADLCLRVASLRTQHEDIVIGEAKRLGLSSPAKSSIADLLKLLDAVTEQIEHDAIAEEGVQPEGATP